MKLYRSCNLYSAKRYELAICQVFLIPVKYKLTFSPYIKKQLDSSF